MVIDKGPFCQLLQYQRPSTKDNNIPHQQKLCDEVVEKAKLAIQCLMEHLEVWFLIFFLLYYPYFCV